MLSSNSSVSPFIFLNFRTGKVSPSKHPSSHVVGNGRCLLLSSDSEQAVGVLLIVVVLILGLVVIKKLVRVLVLVLVKDVVLVTVVGLRVEQ